MEVNIIVAVDKNGLFGLNDHIPWHCPEDLKRFKAITKGHAVIMGRKTWDSLPFQPLPDRTNIIVSANARWSHQGDRILATDLISAIGKAQRLKHEKAFVIGGERLYKEALNTADYIYRTVIHQRIPVLHTDENARYFDMPYHGFKLIEALDHGTHTTETWKRYGRQAH